MRDKSNLTKNFNSMLKDMKNDKKVTELISVKSRSENISLYTVMTKFINIKATVLQKDYGFDKEFNIFDKIDNNCNKIYPYKALISKDINKKWIARVFVNYGV